MVYVWRLICSAGVTMFSSDSTLSTLPVPRSACLCRSAGARLGAACSRERLSRCNARPVHPDRRPRSRSTRGPPGSLQR